MKKIKIGLSNFSFVNNKDFESLSKYKWFIGQGYAKREVLVSSNPRKRKVISMHRQIMGFPDSDIDHINRNKLDNRRSNLRETTKSLNGLNRGMQSNNKLKIKGVCIDKRTGKYRVYKSVNSKRVYDRLFTSIVAAKSVSQQLERYHAN